MVLCIVIHVMPEYALDWVPGSGICLYQETLYRSVSCRRRLRRTAPCETPGMATQVRLAFPLHEKVILPKFVGVRKYVINSEAI